VLVGGDAANGGGAIEADVEVARSCDFDTGDSLELGSAVMSSAASSVAMARGALRRRLASSKATGRASSPRGDAGRLLDGQLREGDVRTSRGVWPGFGPEETAGLCDTCSGSPLG